MKTLATLAILIHFTISLAHGYAHQQLGVGLSTWQTYYVMIVITLAPLIALTLLWMRRVRAGFALLALSMFGSLVFGGYYHYIAVSSDHVSHLPSGDAQAMFRLTALLLMITELFGVIVGSVGLRRIR